MWRRSAGRVSAQLALIARPRRFGKTLNMAMIREFFDMAVDSRGIFDGLAIMDTEYAGQLNTKPVIFLTFKDCKGTTASHVQPLLLIDEYDQPIISSYERGYHEEVGDFFSDLYGSAMKGNQALGRHCSREFSVFLRKVLFPV